MKNNTIAKNLNLGLMVILFVCPIYGIQKSTAHIGTGVIALLSAAGSCQAFYLNNQKIHPVVFGSASAIFTALTYYCLYSITPEGRLQRADKYLNELSRHKLVRNFFESEELFFDAVHDVYLTDDLPLISSYNHLISLLPIVHSACGLISKAMAEVGKNSLLQEECDAASSRAKVLFANISSAIKRIREHKDYLAQLQIYKEFLANEKHNATQEQIASAQLQMAQAQKSSTLLKWLKALFWGK